MDYNSITGLVIAGRYTKYDDLYEITGPYGISQRMVGSLMHARADVFSVGVKFPAEGSLDSIPPSIFWPAIRVATMR